MTQAAVRGERRARSAKAKPSRWTRWLPRLSAAMGVALAVLWWAVHRFDWMGPLVANGLRSVVGVSTVARLEDFTYALEDRYNRLARGQEAPKSYWAVPATAKPALALAAPAPSNSSTRPALPPFRLKDPGPAVKAFAATGDGVWVPIVDPRRPDEDPYMLKTLVHPDRERGWSEVFVVAIDLRRATLHVVAGTQEPKPDNAAAEQLERPAMIPARDDEELLAAFNGGFMTEHGGYGMMVYGVTIVSPKPKACTIAVFTDGSLHIAPWTELEPSAASMVWYRQAPECMVRGGKLHPGIIFSSGNRKWGATLDGETVIRRSGIGLNATRDVLFVSITNHTNARVFAEALRHVGAVDIAQLDVNWSYPKFVLFEPKEPGGPRKAVPLASGFEFSEDEYIRKRSRRDFFYLMRKPTDDATPSANATPSASATPSTGATPSDTATPSTTAAASAAP